MKWNMQEMKIFGEAKQTKQIRVTSSSRLDAPSQLKEKQRLALSDYPRRGSFIGSGLNLSWEFSLLSSGFETQQVMDLFSFWSTVTARGLKLYSLKALAHQLSEKP